MGHLWLGSTRAGGSSARSRDTSCATAPRSGARFAAGARLGAMPTIDRLPPAMRDAVAHALGYILGDKLYNGLLAGKVTKKEVRALFYDPLPPGVPEARYLALVARVADVSHDVLPPGERF